MDKAENIALKGREVWFDGRRVSEERQEVWGLVNNSPISDIIVTAGQKEQIHFPVKTRIITWIDRNTPLHPGTG